MGVHEPRDDRRVFTAVHGAFTSPGVDSGLVTFSCKDGKFSEGCPLARVRVQHGSACFSMLQHGSACFSIQPNICCSNFFMLSFLGGMVLAVPVGRCHDNGTWLSTGRGDRSHQLRTHGTCPGASYNNSQHEAAHCLQQQLWLRVPLIMRLGLDMP